MIIVVSVPAMTGYNSASKNWIRFNLLNIYFQPGWNGFISPGDLILAGAAKNQIYCIQSDYSLKPSGIFVSVYICTLLFYSKYPCYFDPIRFKGL